MKLRAINLQVITLVMTMDEDDQKVKTMIEDFLADLRPGAKLEIPNVGRLEYLAGRRLTYFKYRTGELRVWEIPDSHELSIMKMVQAYLAKLLN